MAAAAVIDLSGLDALLATLRADGYRVVGPRARDGSVVLDDLARAADLPAGWTIDDAPGTSRLRRRTDDACFGFAVGPQSWKQFLFPPRVRLWQSSRAPDDGFTVEEPPPAATRLALVGVRPCDLAAIAVQDRVLLGGVHPDPDYAARRDGAFVVAAQCTTASGTCFCTSLGTGPRAAGGFDLALTEVVDATRHEFVVEVGSAPGAALLDRLPHRPATAADGDAAAALTRQAAQRITRRLPDTDIPALLATTLEHPRWDDVAQRCLACTNCTLVCPTCFCTAVEDVTDLAGAQAVRERRWDSCFALGHSYLHGGPVRASVRARYRQWLTHKLGTWWDQFGTSGCVGCGRCVTWCPAGIDLVAELRALAGEEVAA